MKIQVRVKPSSKTDEVLESAAGYTVKVKEPPLEGRANEAVVKLLAEHFGVARSQVRILAGHRSRSKLIGID